MIPSDHSLITQYLIHNQTFAFDQLVCRHSEMVMKVCTNMLSQRADVEDAFQATFLVLARKVHTLRDRASIAGWLYEVAIRNCLQVRQRRSRAREIELLDDEAFHDSGLKKNTNPIAEPWQIVAQSQEAKVVLAEINKLPKKYREVIVLCCIDEHSRRDTANLLNQTEPTVKGLLARARRLLKSRLVRRGIAPAVALAATQAKVCLGAPAAVSPSLLSATLRTCADPFPSEVLTEDTTIPASKFVYVVAIDCLRKMGFIARARLATLAAVILVSVAIPFAVLAQNSSQSETSVANSLQNRAKKESTTTQQVKSGNQPQNEKHIEITGATFYERFRQITPALFEGEKLSVTTSVSGVVADANGEPVESALVALRVLIGGNSDRRKFNGIIAKSITDAKGKYSFQDVRHLRKDSLLEVVAAREDGRLGWQNFSWKKSKTVANISLAETIPVRGRVVDEKGVPVSNVKLSLLSINPRRGDSPMPTNFYLRHCSPEVQTNSNGQFEFPALPRNVSIRMYADHPDFAIAQYPEVDTGSSPTELVDFELKTGKNFSGRISDRNSKPIAGVEICFPGRAINTASDGRFSFLCLEESLRDEVLHLRTRHPDFGVSKHKVKAHELKAGSAEIKLLEPAIIRGRVVSKDNGLPVSGAKVGGIRGQYSQQNFSGTSVYLNDNGEFVLEGLLPGEWTLSLGGSAPGFDLLHEDCIEREITVKEGETKEIDFAVPRISPIAVRVLDQQGQPIAGAKVNALFRSANQYRHLFKRQDWPETDMGGSASLDPDRQPDGSTVLIAKWESNGKTYWAQRYWNGRSEPDALNLKPAATLKGKVSVSGRPIVGAKLYVSSKHQSVSVVEGDMVTAMAVSRSFDSVETDSNGVYSLQVPAVNPNGNQPVYMLSLKPSGDIPNPDVDHLQVPASFDGVEFKRDFELVEGKGKVSGLVVDALGKPVANVLVNVFQISLPENEARVHPARLYQPSEMTTDKDGKFAMEGLPIGAVVSLATRHSNRSKPNENEKAYRANQNVLVNEHTQTKFTLPRLKTNVSGETSL